MTRDLFDHFKQITNYPKEWKLVELNELIHDLRGGSPLEPEDFLKKGFPVLHKGAIKPFGEIEIDPNKKAFTHDAFVRKYSNSVITKDYLAVTLRDLIPSGPSIGLISTLYSSPYREYILAQGAYGFLVNTERVYPDYLVWLSNTNGYRKFIRTLAVGSTQIHVRTPVFTSVPIPLPPLAEQKLISAIAQKADRLRRTRRYTLKLSDTFLQSVFLEIFGDPISNPMEWKKYKLSNLCRIRRGASPRPIEDYLGGTVPWIKIGDGAKQSSLYLSATKDYVTEEGAKKSVFLNKGSLIFANCGVSLGFARILKIDGCIHDGWLSFDNLDPQLNQIFFLRALNQLTLYFRSLAPDGTQPNLNTEIMGNFSLILPPLALQEKFAQIVQKFERLRTQQQEAERQAEHLFQTILHRAFRGELFSQDFNNDRASDLLEQIDAEQTTLKAEALAANQTLAKASKNAIAKSQEEDLEAIQLTLPF